ncbi:unnamed protein product [Rhizopus stolonifer]
MNFFHCCLTLLIFIQFTLAQFRLLFPVPRGNSETNRLIPPCGGYDIANQSRTQVPLETPFVEIDSERDAYSYRVHAIVGNNSSSADYFDTSPSYISVASGTRDHANASCLQLSLPQNISNGANVTLQVAYNSSNGIYFQCTDITFLQNMSDFNKSLCFDSNGTHPLIQPNTTYNSHPVSLDHASDASDSFQLVTGLMLCAASLVSFFLI